MYGSFAAIKSTRLSLKKNANNYMISKETLAIAQLNYTQLFPIYFIVIEKCLSGTLSNISPLDLDNAVKATQISLQA